MPSRTGQRHQEIPKPIPEIIDVTNVQEFVELGALCTLGLNALLHPMFLNERFPDLPHARSPAAWLGNCCAAVRHLGLDDQLTLEITVVAKVAAVVIK